MFWDMFWGCFTAIWAVCIIYNFFNLLGDAMFAAMKAGQRQKWVSNIVVSLLLSSFGPILLGTGKWTEYSKGLGPAKTGE